ncbi:unnamed protein product [Chondrus crispus]|uniref:Uncharacterized protein n=1 Tax=Chondrus crispus TaxID=2769 RepID=R7QEY0_CHOCR|nr:unnamed protein product [Chondrus crispus]CDF37067.1 unnamed protein product [Chondrus crispus]|eukprot:XP_005716886.1 unnamed protein product [Chondrus crispus]
MNCSNIGANEITVNVEQKAYETLRYRFHTVCICSFFHITFNV